MKQQLKFHHLSCTKTIKKSQTEPGPIFQKPIINLSDFTSIIKLLPEKINYEKIVSLKWVHCLRENVYPGDGIMVFTEIGPSFSEINFI